MAHLGQVVVVVFGYEEGMVDDAHGLIQAGVSGRLGDLIIADTVQEGDQFFAGCPEVL